MIVSTSREGAGFAHALVIHFVKVHKHDIDE
jgi:hypothetical protein